MARLFDRLRLLTFTGLLGFSACSRGTSSTPEQAAAAPGSATLVSMTVTADGFIPSQTHLRVGQPVTLIVTRKIEHTCATDIVIKDFGVSKPLPQDQPVEITFTPTKPGPIHYSCAMGMVSGELVAE
ncbi:MAG: cupredoxin domain-containing protein [Pseudomonadota bacterium]